MATACNFTIYLLTYLFALYWKFDHLGNSAWTLALYVLDLYLIIKKGGGERKFITYEIILK